MTRGNVSIPFTQSFNVVAVNDPPVVSAIETTPLAYGTAGSAVAISSTLLVTDADDVTLVSATVQIALGYQNGQDILKFVNTSKITGSFNAATGTLTLTGVDSVSDYRTALRSVMYSNTSTTPAAGTRKISFQANDGHAANNLSTYVSRNITVG